MAKYTFKQFQAEYPNDAACLAKLMEINYGGTWREGINLRFLKATRNRRLQNSSFTSRPKAIWQLAVPL
jgi:hypothetical protein